MTAIGGALGEARWVVGRLRPLGRYEEGRPDRGKPRLGATIADGEPPLPYRVAIICWRARVARCLAAGAHRSCPHEGPARGGTSNSGVDTP